MRLRAFLLATVILATCVAAAPPSDPKAKALAWLTQVGAAATAELASAQRDLEAANKAIASSQNAMALAREHHDAKSESDADGVLARAQAAASEAAERMKTAQVRVDKIKSVMADIVPGATGVALEISGAVEISSNGVRKPWNGSPAALKPGDLISTGGGGRLVMVFDDGRVLKLGENSTFQFIQKPSAAADAPLLERAAGYLRSGVMRLNKRIEQLHQPVQLPYGNPKLGPMRSEVDYRTPTAVVAVRGTEFQLTATANEPTRFVPISGEVEIKADVDGLKNYAAKPWWTNAPDTIPAPTQGAVVASISGGGDIVGADGTRRAISRGQSVSSGEHVVAGEKSVVMLRTTDGYKIALAPTTRLDVARDPKTGGVVYILREGRMHVWGNGAPSKTRFLTPNSVTAPAAKEFEVSVGTGGAATFLPIDGALTVTAVANRLDWSKLPELRN